ncbi:hypothetical protein SK128_020001, partial [Halocaridina rubra]
CPGQISSVCVVGTVDASHHPRHVDSEKKTQRLMCRKPSASVTATTTIHPDPVTASNANNNAVNSQGHSQAAKALNKKVKASTKKLTINAPSMANGSSESSSKAQHRKHEVRSLFPLISVLFPKELRGVFEACLVSGECVCFDLATLCKGD